MVIASGMNAIRKKLSSVVGLFDCPLIHIETLSDNTFLIQQQTNTIEWEDIRTLTQHGFHIHYIRHSKEIPLEIMVSHKKLWADTLGDVYDIVKKRFADAEVKKLRGAVQVKRNKFYTSDIEWLEWCNISTYVDTSRLSRKCRLLLFVKDEAYEHYTKSNTPAYDYRMSLEYKDVLKE